MSVYLIKRDGETIGVADSEPQGIGLIQWFNWNVPAYSMDHATAHEGYSVEEVDEIDCHDVESVINAICQRKGVTMTAEFVPLSQSRNAGKDGKPWRSLNWRVTVANGVGREVLAMDYSQGEGFAPACKAKMTVKPDSFARRLRDEAIDHEVETGRIAGRLNESSGVFSKKPIPAPSIGEVMQSLVSDADVLDAGGFEEWAREFGFDEDSRAAEATYRACVEIATKLRAGLGEPLLSEIRLVARFN